MNELYTKLEEQLRSLEIAYSKQSYYEYLLFLSKTCRIRINLCITSEYKFLLRIYDENNTPISNLNSDKPIPQWINFDEADSQLFEILSCLKNEYSDK